MKRGTVLFLTPGCFDKGGISRYSRYQIRALRELSGEQAVTVLSLLGPDQMSFETPLSVAWAGGGNGTRQKAGFVARAMSAAIRTRPSVIMSAHINMGALGLAAAAVAGSRTTVNVYGHEVWSGLRRDAAWALKVADLVISDCHFTRSYLLEQSMRPGDRPSEVLWDCVDTDRFGPGVPDRAVLERYAIPDPADHINVLTLGRLSSAAAHKGYDRLLEAFAMAARAIRGLRLIYAGQGDMIDGLRTRAAQLGLANRVVFTGAVHERDLADVYRSAHIFSLVSDRGKGRGEGIPLTPLEAAACEKPIDRKSTRLNSSHSAKSRMPSSA